MKILKSALCAPAGAILSLAMMSGSLQAATVVNDSFTDLDRANTGALQADWWSSNSTSGNSVEIDATGLGLVSGTSGRGIHGTFATQNLAVGDSVTVTYSFNTPTTVATNKGGAFRVALMDGSNPLLADDLSSASGVGNENPIYQNLPGYMADYDINTGAAADTTIREHDAPGTVGRFLGTTSGWTSLGSSGDAGYAITALTDYVGVFSVTRTGADSLDIFTSLSQGTTLLDSHMKTDSSGIANNFGMFALWANSNVFGSTTGSDPDNGITLTNVLVESTVVPVPAAAWLFGSALLGLSALRRKRS